jgi:CHASE3 domain sensor protein
VIVNRRYNAAYRADVDENLGWIQAAVAVVGLGLKLKEKKKAKKDAQRAKDKARKELKAIEAVEKERAAAGGMQIAGAGGPLMYAALGLGALALLGVVMGARR